LLAVLSAELHTIIREVAQTQTAFNTFDIKYDEIPGDMPNAYDYWGAIGKCDDTSSQTYTTATGQNGCNGDGSRNYNAGSEPVRAWHHLDLSDVLPNTVYVDGVNKKYHRTSKMGGLFSLGSSGNKTTLVIGNEISIGSATWNFGGLLTPAEAKSIDKKLDNGIAATGDVIANDSIIMGVGYAPCLDSGTYNLTNDSRDCMVSFIIE
jgi:hypothetical protein